MSLYFLIIFLSLNKICSGLPNRQFQQDGIEKAAALMRQSINGNVNPCDNFYEFTCGNWAANNPIPPNHNKLDHFAILRGKILKTLKDLFEESAISPSRIINLAKTMFKNCMDTEELNRQKASLLNEQLEKFGYWPILHGEKWDVSNFDLTQLLTNLAHSRAVLDVFIKFDVEIDSRNTSRHIVILNHGKPIIPKQNYQNETVMQQYLTAIIRMVESIAADTGIFISHERISQDAQEILKFERDFINIMTPPGQSFQEYQRKMIYLMDTDEVKSFYHRFSYVINSIPELDLLEYSALLLPISDRTTLASYFASNPDVYYHFDANFLNRLSYLLKTTNKRTIANYVLLRYANEWREIGKEFQAVVINRNRSDQCIMEMCPGIFDTNKFGPFDYVCDTIYATKFFNKESNEAINKMVNNLHDVFARMLEDSQWLDPQTKKQAKDKLVTMLKQIGYPIFLLRDKPLEALDAYHSKMNLHANDTYATMKEKASQWWISHKFRKLVLPVDRNVFDLSNCIANAVYNPSKNSILISSALFEAPFFDESFPIAMNYGGIGTILGHEITHGFDDRGAKYDMLGNYRNWWQLPTLQHFNQRKQCFIDQYSLMRIPEINENLNGQFTLGENIADNGGLKEAFKAYKYFLQETGHIEKQVPGFESYTSEQLFFINFGLYNCEHPTKESLEYQYKEDNHSPRRYRVNGAVQNFPDFATAFNCQIGSPMNPEKKCTLW